MRSLSWYVCPVSGLGRVSWDALGVRLADDVSQENWEMSNGPLSLLQTAVRSHSQVLISIRSNRKL